MSTPSSSRGTGTSSSGDLSVPLKKSFQKTMRETFGIAQFRPGQREVIESVLSGKDTLAIMPTGSGKSLCYQLPALKMPGVTVIVSPLIALMKDQAEKLQEAGIEATEINSSLNESEEQEALQTIQSATEEFIFTTPERLTQPEFLATLKRRPIDLFVIDEAHCISQWGHDFRPAYLALHAAAAALGDPPILALTATATGDVVDDIRQQLRRPGMHVINTGTYRENLNYQVIQATNEEEKYLRMLQLIHKRPGPGIIYAATVKAVEQIHHYLQEHGEAVVAYHGKLGRKQRDESQSNFMLGDCRIMVATNAFGMGIDKSDIRFVIHFHMPANLEAYYQESGRAGRDLEPADCTLLYFFQDKRIQQFFMGGRYPTEEEISPVYETVESISSEHPAMSLAQLQEHLSDFSQSRLRIILKLLTDADIIEQDSNLSYRMLQKNVKHIELTKLASRYQEKHAHDREALEQMVFYAQTGFCRWKVLLEYFGEEVEWERCNHCDNCLHPPALAESSDVSSVEANAAPSKDESTRSSLADLEAGQSVRVPRFGEGRIVEVNGDKVTIVFADNETKTFMRSYVEPM